MEHGHGEGKRMTREQQEAIAVLQEFYDYNKTLTPHGESWLQADITINRETQRNLAEALPLAIKAMSRLLTDPDTGLVPCGCGGKAEVGDGNKAFCGRCGITTLEQFTQEDAKSEWNRAMGVKEEDE